MGETGKLGFEPNWKEKVERRKTGKIHPIAEEPIQDANAISRDAWRQTPTLAMGNDEQGEDEEFHRGGRSLRPCEVGCG
jgi:hypothetical protein